MSLHACAGCDAALPFQWNLKNLPFCKTCFSYLKPNTNINPKFFYAFSSHAVSHKILRHWKKHPHSVFENEIFRRAHPVLIQLKNTPPHESWNYIVPIPQRGSRAFFLGGGPARRIAMRLSRFLKIPVVEILEKQNPNTLPQAKKSLQERFESPMEFQVTTDHELDCVGKKILLVDDFMTSGQTIQQAKQALVRAGFDKVGVFVLGHRPHFFKGNTQF